MNNTGTGEGTNEDSKKRGIVKSSVYIAAVLAGLVGLTFVFRLAALRILNTPLRITVIYLIYIGMAALVFVACRIEKRRVWDLGFSKEKLHLQILIGIGIAVGLSFLIGALPILISGGTLSFIGQKPNGIFDAIFDIVTPLVFIGFFEELIFRGYIQTRINEWTRHTFVGVLIAAALFGLWHIINGNWFQVAFAFGIGAIFGFCRVHLKACSLLSVIIAHGLYDALLVVIAIVLL